MIPEEKVLTMLSDIQHQVRQRTNRVTRYGLHRSLAFGRGHASDLTVGREVIRIEISEIVTFGDSLNPKKLRHKVTLKASGLKSRVVRETKKGGFRSETIVRNILELVELKRLEREDRNKQTRFIRDAKLVAERLKPLVTSSRVSVGYNTLSGALSLSIRELEENEAAAIINQLNQLMLKFPKGKKDEVFNFWDQVKELDAPAI